MNQVHTDTIPSNQTSLIQTAEVSSHSNTGEFKDFRMDRSTRTY